MAKTEKAKKGEHFVFAKNGIAVGEVLEFKPTGDLVRVAHGNKVEFHHETRTMQDLANELCADCRGKRSTDFFLYKGVPLSAWREVLQMNNFFTKNRASIVPAAGAKE